MTVFGVCRKIVVIEYGQFGLIPHHDEILSIFVLGLLGEIKTARQHRATVDDHDFVMSDRMNPVDPHINSMTFEIAKCGIGLCFVRFVE